MGKVELRFEIDEELVRRLEASGIDTHQAAEAGLRHALEALAIESAEERAAQWRAQNHEALQARRDRIAQHGVFGEDLRRW